MDPRIGATKNEIPSSEEEETKGLEKKDNHQTTLNLLKQPQSMGDSATTTAVGSGGVDPSQLTATLAAEEAGQKEDVGACPDSAVEEDQKTDSERLENDGEKFKGQKQESSPTVQHVQDQSRAEVEEAQKIDSEKSDSDLGTASVAAKETAENGGDKKHPDSSEDGGKILKTQKPPTDQMEPPVQEQPRPEEAPPEKFRANEGDGTRPDSFDERTVIHGTDERENKMEEAQKIDSEKSDSDPGTASVAAKGTAENEGDKKHSDSSEDGGKILKTQKPPIVQMEPPVQEQPRPEGLGTASVAAQEQEENEGDKKRPDSSDGEKFKGLKQESPPTVQHVQDQSRAEGPLYMKMAVLMAGLAVIIGLICFDYSSGRPAPKEDSKIDIFHREFEKMKSSFPSQREELWKRSIIHLEKHLQMADPTEPVSMILTAGRRAEGTLRCLATHMAETFSSALGASVLHIDGASRAALESGQVKLDIDEQLGGAFEGNRRAAIIHRFEELPPGSTLIFYRYCDHENAAYKKSFLIFTVLLEEEDLKSHLSLSAVEEIVQDHVQDKFLSSTHPTSFDKMDVDKFSGLWSRISHLILPVAVEELMEMQGCES